MKGSPFLSWHVLDVYMLWLLAENCHPRCHPHYQETRWLHVWLLPWRRCVMSVICAIISTLVTLLWGKSGSVGNFEFSCISSVSVSPVGYVDWIGYLLVTCLRRTLLHFHLCWFLWRRHGFELLCCGWSVCIHLQAFFLTRSQEFISRSESKTLRFWLQTHPWMPIKSRLVHFFAVKAKAVVSLGCVWFHQKPTWLLTLLLTVKYPQS